MKSPDEMKSPSDGATVKCGTHGMRSAAIVCCRMTEAKEKSVGFVENNSDPDDLQAWCGAYEQLFFIEGDKAERFVRFNNFAVVCDFCYASLK
jgi:hypothetical protein